MINEERMMVDRLKSKVRRWWVQQGESEMMMQMRLSPQQDEEMKEWRWWWWTRPLSLENVGDNILGEMELVKIMIIERGQLGTWEELVESWWGARVGNSLGRGRRMLTRKEMRKYVAGMWISLGKMQVKPLNFTSLIKIIMVIIIVIIIPPFLIHVLNYILLIHMQFN